MNLVLTPLGVDVGKVLYCTLKSNSYSKVYPKREV